MNTVISQANDDTQIRELIDVWADAVRAKDVDRIMSLYAPNLLSFDAISQLQFKGADAYWAHWETCMTYCPGPMVFEIHELNVAAAEDVAFAHFLNHCGGTTEQGEEQSGWMRATVCYRRTQGAWKIAHEHFSAPFEMETGKALLDLAP